jgi:hypothetical protein
MHIEVDKKFFHSDLSVLNSFILLTSCDSKFSYLNVRLALIRDLIQDGGRIGHRLFLRGDQVLPQLN